MRANTIVILNAVTRSGFGVRHTTRRRAAEYVAEGRADWVGGSQIRFRPEHRAHVAAVKSVRKLMTMDAQGYDAIGRIRLDQIAGIPVLFPWKLIRGKSHASR